MEKIINGRTYEIEPLATLRGADLHSATLDGATLRDADLRGADLSYADLSGADLSYADLTYADLSYADLSGADLSGADLRGADLSGATLDGATLRDADLRDACNIPAEVGDATSILPDGDIIGWKKCRNDVIVKLLIPADASRSNATGRKCRASKAKVLEVFGADHGVSHYARGFTYHAGETVACDCFDENRWNECSNGIHFFITRGEAERYLWS